MFGQIRTVYTERIVTDELFIDAVINQQDSIFSWKVCITKDGRTVLHMGKDSNLRAASMNVDSLMESEDALGPQTYPKNRHIEWTSVFTPGGHVIIGP